jgi:type II secretory pathway pseudopilin PulG
MTSPLKHYFYKVKRGKLTFAGFTLVEAMIGLFILSIAIGGPMLIAGRAAQDIRQSRETFTATYLAQEVIEIIRFKRDSIFLECSDATSLNCAPITFSGQGGVPVTEFPQEAAWRIFKDHFGQTLGVSSLCFSAEGCAFDSQSILSSPIAKPIDLYAPTDTNCSSLFQDKSNSLKVAPAISALDYMYLCSSHKAPASVDTGIKRTVRMVSTSTFPGGSYDSLYGDEIRVDVTVVYPLKGIVKTLTVTDYIKPRS